MKDVSYLKDGRKLVIGDYSYRKDGDNVILTRYAGHKSRVKIPEGVTDLADESFADARITQVDLPSTIKTIGRKAFYCSAVRKVHLPRSVETVRERAFDCSGLTELTIDNPNAYFYPEAFDHAYDLTTIRFAGTKEQWEEISENQIFSASFTVFFPDGTTQEHE